MARPTCRMAFVMKAMLILVCSYLTSVLAGPNDVTEWGLNDPKAVEYTIISSNGNYTFGLLSVIDLDRGSVWMTFTAVTKIEFTFDEVVQRAPEEIVAAWRREEPLGSEPLPPPPQPPSAPSYTYGAFPGDAPLDLARHSNPRSVIMDFVRGDCRSVTKEGDHIGINVGNDGECDAHCGRLFRERCWRRGKCCYRGLPAGFLPLLLQTDDPELIRLVAREPRLLRRALELRGERNETVLMQYLAYPDVVRAILSVNEDPSFVRAQENGRTALLLTP
eukprot:TRINITY_DN7979_c0_g1_i1.p1 TRINITY_DN7979_c0_g1~~TRINITY_DN7979_c0_g1_i1.p1  ORF type:complete len:293 (+),score=38.34 TRINITY_DN7979_c0_g1_i1:52-879(+)